MTRLERELERLAARLKRLGGRCVVCAEWPRVRYENDWRPPKAQTDTCPAACPRCGYRPVTISYVHTWRSAD